jgi:excisionase family DNA binding protein
LRAFGGHPQPMGRRYTCSRTLLDPAPTGARGRHPARRTLASMADMAADNGGQPEAGRWVTYEDAARRLRISLRTVERWVKDGKLRRGQPIGGRAVVWVADMDGGHEAAMAADSDGQERAVLLVDRVSLAVSRQLEAVTAQLATVTERNEVLARENGRLMERVAGAEREIALVRHVADADRQRAEALEAERDAVRLELEAVRAQISTLDASGAAGSADPTTEPSTSPGAPWWRRWRAWLAAGLVVAVVGSASCQAPGSIKHLGLCTALRREMDGLSKEQQWAIGPMQGVDGVTAAAQRVC